MTTVHVKHGGVWKAPSKLFVKHAGAWKEPVGAWVKDAGTWKSFWSSLSPTLDLNFLTTTTLDPRIALTRTTTGTHFGSDGLLKTAAINAARFDHEIGTGVPRGLLTEDQKTNLVRWCRDLTNVVWVKTNCTAAKNQIGIDGTANSASALTAAAANATCLQAITSVSSPRAPSAFVKRLTGSGAVQMTVDNGVTWTAVTVTPSWTRVEIPNQTLANPTTGFRLVTSGDSIAVDYAQVEVGPGATSPIATTTAALSRTTDNTAINDANFTSWYNQSEGTFVSETRIQNDIVSAHPWHVYVAANVSQTISLSVGGGGAITAQMNISPGGNQASISLGTAVVNTIHKFAFAVKQNDAAACRDGGTVGTDVVCTMPLGMDRMYLGRGGAGGKPQHIRRFTYYNTRLPNATLQALTAP